MRVSLYSAYIVGNVRPVVQTYDGQVLAVVCLKYPFSSPVLMLSSFVGANLNRFYSVDSENWGGGGLGGGWGGGWVGLCCFPWLTWRQRPSGGCAIALNAFPTDNPSLLRPHTCKATDKLTGGEASIFLFFH